MVKQPSSVPGSPKVVTVSKFHATQDAEASDFEHRFRSRPKKEDPQQPTASLKGANRSLNLIQRTALQVDKREVSQGSLAYNKRNQTLDQSRPLLMQQGQVTELAASSKLKGPEASPLNGLTSSAQGRSSSVQPTRPAHNLPVVKLEPRGPERPMQQLVAPSQQLALLKSPLRSGADSGD